MTACTANVQCLSGLCINGFCTSTSSANPFPLTYIPGAVLTQTVNDVPVTLTGLIPAPSPLCGNKTLDLGEECDDGNQFDLDGCSAYCLLEYGTCGDRVVQSLMGEQCEPSLTSVIPCGVNCRFRLVSCGDGVIHMGEACDDAGANSNAPGARCRPDCSLARCGDAILDRTEECDDRNRLPGDGCDAFCRNERAAGYAETLPGQVIEMPWQPGYATPLQGDGKSGKGANIGNAPQTTESGPGAIAMMAAGAAAGYAWIRRRRS
jgi:MYXO-CTERM domain-containing protein